jgi:hypothetical protein
MTRGNRERYEGPPPSTNGWGRLIDSEVRAIGRELDHRGRIAVDHEHRLRDAERSILDHEHSLEAIAEIERRLTVIERGMRIVIWVMAALAAKSSPDFAFQLIANISGRSAG